ncbi:response regulator transcription factor [Oxalobacteraceae bacterium]|nr:response regulator transcription factor [Oxalobacteraceae bacterium]
MINAISTRKVLIIESLPVVASAIETLLNGITHTEVTIDSNAQHAMTAVANCADFDLIFVDLDLAGTYGLSLVRHFARAGYARRCIAMSALHNSQWCAEARAMGLLGYIPKTTPLAEFQQGIASVMRGHDCFLGGPASATEASATHLTRRQLDIIGLLHRGYTSKKIATQLKLNAGTVDNHVTGLMRALNASSRTHAVARAMELGYLHFRDLPVPAAATV